MRGTRPSNCRRAGLTDKSWNRDWAPLSNLRDLLHRSPRLINSTIGVGVGSCVAVRNRNPAGGQPCHLAGNLSTLEPEFIEQRVVFIRVAMRPAVDCDGSDVGCGIEASWAQGRSELLADFALDGFKVGGEQFNPSEAMLVARRESGAARRSQHVDHSRLVRRYGAVVVTHAYWQVEPKIRVVASGCVQSAGSEFLKRNPIPYCDVGVEQRNFRARLQSRLLFFGQLRTNVRYHHVPAGEYGRRRAHAVEFSQPRVGKFDALRRRGIAFMPDSHHGAVQANPDGRGRVIQLGVVRLRS